MGPSGRRSGRLSDGTFAEVAGSGPTVVLLHGVGLNHKMWLAQTAALAGAHRTIAYDLLGHGKSPKIGASVCLEDFCGQLGRVLDAFEVERACIAGFSFGGLIAQKFAMQYPERLHKLVLMSTVYNRTGDERVAASGRLKMARDQGPASIIPAAIERWFSPAFTAGQPDIIGEVERLLHDNDKASFLATYSLFCNTSDELSGALRHIDCPVLAMTGSLDTGSTPAMVDRMVADGDRVQGKVIEGGRHLMPIEMVDEVNAALLAFLKDNEE